MRKLILAIKSIGLLGWKSSLQYAWYKLLLKSGIYRLILPSRSVKLDPSHLSLCVPSYKELASKVKEITADKFGILLKEADEICDGKVSLFGGEAVPLELAPVKSPSHWSKFHNNQLDGRDIKVIWEPGRFGWLMTLARAYAISEDEKYADKALEYIKFFRKANPVNRGPHWLSAQEVGLRLISLTFVYSMLEDAATDTQKQMLAEMLAEHAARIPPTLIYARAQRNNHLLTEAAALYTAGCILENHPSSNKWKELGWKHFIEGIDDQVESDGTYIQHSTNYHRLMLHTALWMQSMAEWQGKPFPENITRKLEQAYRWLLAVTDMSTGQVPNLGANDGANILPLSVSDFSDFRPVLQAAGIAFAGEKPFPDGEWNELSAWLLPEIETNPVPMDQKESWGIMRCAKYNSRPSHSDQLHVDLWWRGFNITPDPGTYSYNSDSPWDNSLKVADVHNTVTINSQDHMTSAGRFRWVDIAQGSVVGTADGLIRATHDGYHKLGIEHFRELQKHSEQVWTITDMIQPLMYSKGSYIEARCHWLLPDWKMEIKEDVLRIKSPQGWIRIGFESELDSSLDIARAGEQLVGKGHCPPYRGWVSRTYLHKEPARSLVFTIKAQPPFSFTTTFIFPE